MAFRVDEPLVLLLLPVAALCVVLLHRRYRIKARSIKRGVSLALRLAVVALTVLALASPSVLSAAQKPSRWLLMDVSGSASSSRDNMEQRIRDELQKADKSERLGVIVYGDGAMVEAPLSDEPTFDGVYSAVGGDATDLDAALRLASVLLPGGVGGITVLGDELAAAQRSTIDLLVAGGVKVDTLTYDIERGADAQITELTAPAQAYEGQSLTVRAVIDSSAAMEGTLALYQNGELTATRDVKLQKGENRFAFTDIASETGLMRYEARLISGDDGSARNNRASAFVSVQGQPNVLLVTNGSTVEDLLAASGAGITSARPKDMPSDSAGYLPYDAVALDNIGYDEASEAQWQALKSAVQTLGRGLCVLGGDNSYALGGYRGTALEELLPVSIDARSTRRIPALSLVLAIDKSGSMATGLFGTAIIELAKEAAIQSVAVLSEKDKVGVIGFDDTAKWVVPFGYVTDIAEVERLIGTLRADGGTAFYSPLSEAFRVLANSGTPQKHVIFLSDGQPADSGYQDIALAMNKSGITLTTVAVGSGADARALNLLATLGGGRSYAAGEFDDLPKIFTKETMLKSGNYVQNRVFTPVTVEHSTLTDYEGLPELKGYLTTVEKPSASVALMSDEEDPVLAWWRSGAGTVVAWTSDAGGGWSEQYLGWEDAPRFFGGMVAKALRTSGGGGTATAAIEGDSLHIVYSTDAPAADGAVKATIINSEGAQTHITLSQTGEGLYEGEAEAAEQGAYGVRVEREQDGALAGWAECGAVKSFPAEYDIRARGSDGLHELAQETGGMELGEADELRLSTLTPAQTARPLRQALLVAALCVFLLGVALDKLPWELAVEKWLGSVKASRESGKGGAEGAPRNEGKPRKPASAKKQRKQEDMKEAAQTADALLSAAKARRESK